MHSVQRKDTHRSPDRTFKRPDSATNRLSAFAAQETRWSERPVAPYEACYHTSYQGDKIRDAVKEEREGREGSENSSGSDVEKGLDGQKLWTHGLA